MRKLGLDKDREFQVQQWNEESVCNCSQVMATFLGWRYNRGRYTGWPKKLAHFVRLI